MVDIHREGRSQRSAPQKRHTAHLRRRARCTPRKPSGWFGGANKTHPPTGGGCARQAPGHLSCSDLGRHETRAQPSLRPCGVRENLKLSGSGLGSARNPGTAPGSSRQSNQEPEQCRRGKHTHVSPGRPSAVRRCERSPHTPVTFLCSAPPSPQHD